MTAMLTLILFACTPEAPVDSDPALPDPEVVAPRFVDCTMSGVGAFQQMGEWVDYLTRENTYDAWGNLVLDRTEDTSGGARQLDAVFHGSMPLERAFTDLFVSPVVAETDVWTWSGSELVQHDAVAAAVPSRTTYTSSGDPWNEGDVDRALDGTVDTHLTARWQRGRIVETTEDDGADGSIERSERSTFDADGRLVERERIAPDQAVRLEQTWSDPVEGDYLLSARETVTADGPPRVTFRQTTWTADWRTSETQVFVDGALTEIAFLEYDRDGRLLTWLRTFPNGTFSSTRELWEWDCPGE
jgi:hypothetical protein